MRRKVIDKQHADSASSFYEQDGEVDYYSSAVVLISERDHGDEDDNTDLNQKRLRPYCSEPEMQEFRSLMGLLTIFVVLFATSHLSATSFHAKLAVMHEAKTKRARILETATMSRTPSSNITAGVISAQEAPLRRNEAKRQSSYPEKIQYKNVISATLHGKPPNTSVPTDVKLLQDVEDWVRANEGFINPNVRIQTITKALTGMIAVKDIKKNVPICSIPNNLITHVPGSASSRCEQVNAIHAIISKSREELNPYEYYLKTRTAQYHHHMPWLWSESGKQMLKELLGSVWFSGNFANRLDNWRTKCWPNHTMDDLTNEKDQLLLNALAIFHVRYESDHTQYVPYHDVINHGDGHVANAMGGVTKKGYTLRTTRLVKAGEQLVMSYDEGNNFDMYNVEHLFHEYAFVESFPQRFHLLHPINIKVSVYESGNVFLYDADSNDYDDFEESEDEAKNRLSSLPVSKISEIEKELHRLERFEEKYHATQLTTNITPHETNIPDNEHSLLWQFHRAVKNTVEKLLSAVQKS